MSKRTNTHAYKLVLTKDLWSEIDKRRFAGTAITRTAPMTRVDFIRMSIEEYIDWFDRKYSKTLATHRSLIEESPEDERPFGFGYDNGREANWL